jgi:hypothetical protein
MPKGQAFPHPGCKPGPKPRHSLEQQVADNGWLITAWSWFGSHWAVIEGYVGTDLNCGATGVVRFAFFDRRYVGTLAPVASEYYVERLDSVEEQGQELVAHYRFRSNDDPRCCMGYSADVTYALRGDRLSLAQATEISRSR